MALDIELIKKNYKLRKNNIVADDVLNYFEKILEEAGIYGYKNWEKGLVIDGPIVKKYWVTVSLMYAREEMPEPAGGLRLKKYGCEVYFEEGKYSEPVRVMNELNADPQTHKAKIKAIDVWIVHIRMPRRLIENAIDDYISLAALEVTEDDIEMKASEKPATEQADPTMQNAGMDPMEDPNMGQGGAPMPPDAGQMPQ